MNLDLKTVWSGDVHGPDRGLLAASDCMFPIRQPPPPGPVIIRGQYAPTSATHARTMLIHASLVKSEATIPQLMARFGLSQDVIEATFKHFRRLGILRRRPLEHRCGLPRRVFWIAK